MGLTEVVAKDHRSDIEDYVVVTPDGGDHPMVLQDATVCVGNLRHGGHYKLAVREGLRDIHGRAVVPGTREVEVPDRPRRVRFSWGRYVLPAVGGTDISLTTVNLDEVALTLLRITEGNLVDEVMEQRVGRNLDGYDLRDIAEGLGEELWRGTLSIANVRNREVTTAVSVGAMIPERKPGVYVLAATTEWMRNSRYRKRAVQWFVISDIGLLTMRGAVGLTVFARSLSTAEPMTGVHLLLQARNEDTLATLTTDAQGRATFAPGLLRGSGGREAVLLRAHSGDGDYTFLQINAAGFDLSDRGVGGRPAPGPVDAYLYTDRGIYRPGETVHLTALVRDDRGRAIEDLPLKLAIVRPDGVQARDYAVRSDHSGAIPVDYVLSDNALTGAWRFRLTVPDGKVLVGAASVQVEDFVPPRIEVDLEAPETLGFRTPAPVSIAARFLYGAPAADLAVKGRVRVESDPEPFAAWSGYHFGLVEDRPVPGRADLPEGRTGEDGKAVLSLDLPEVAETTHPLRARIDAAVLERGGRPVSKAVIRPLRDGRQRVGIRPRFAGPAAMGRPAVFDVAVADGAGAAVGGRALAWRLYREEGERFWYMQADERWKYREVTMDATVDSGTLLTSADESDPVRIALGPGWGNYRLEVTEAGDHDALPASVRFRVGWGGTGGHPDVPDMMTVRLDRSRYAPGETATVRLEAPSDGHALVTVLTDRVEQVHHVKVVDGAATVSLPVEGWTAGAYVTAATLRPAPATAEQGPGRAVGTAWLAVRDPERNLSVRFDAPKTTGSGRPLRVPFQVTTGSDVPVRARLTVAAVDEGILRMTGFKPPDPAAVVFGKRSMSVVLRDLYGRLIDARRAREDGYRSGGDDGGRLYGGIQPPRTSVVLYQGLMDTDPQGRGEVLLDIPQGFSGRLRLMAVAHTREALGHGHDQVTVRDPMMVDLYLPRFLAPGDEALVTVEMVNTDAPAGDYAPTLSVTGPAAIATAVPETVRLAPGERWSLPVSLSATEPGDAVLRLGAFGPDGVRVERAWTLAVRPAQAWRQTQHPVALEPGGSVRLARDLVADLYPADATVSASVSPVPYDLHALLASLDRYPYGCTEQTISRALPLLYVKALRRGAAGSGDDAEAGSRIQGAVRRVLARQTDDGGFGLWSARGETDPWVSAYALDFLDRARTEGFEVDGAALRRAKNYIVRLLGREALSSDRREAVAYGLAVLARSRTVEPGAVRYFINTRLSRVGSGLGRAKLALAAASFGLAESAETALAAADSALGENSFATYGSGLRDAAVLVAAAAAVKPAALEKAAARLRRIAAEDSHTSTQEKAWMVVAAWELTQAAAATPLTVNGVRVGAGQRGFRRAIDAEELQGDGVTIGNVGDGPVRLLISAGGHPMSDEPAHANGISLERTIRTLEGAPADPRNLRQGDELAVVLEGRLEASALPRRLLVADLLPAGLEIQAAVTENKEYEALGKMDRPDALRLRDDRYVAAITRLGGKSFRLAYLVRAVTPGTFRAPAPYVEDMYDPAIQARGVMGRLTVHR